MPFELNTKPTPQKIHFIWVGGPIYPEYLKSIQGLAQVAKREGYDINLWVDDERNYYKTAHQEHIDIPNLNIRNIREELYANQKQDPFYLGNDPDFPINKKDEAAPYVEEKPGDRSIKFQSYVERELVGFKNFAAAADLLRLEILRQEGGWYLDTDTYFPDINPPFSPKLIQGTAYLTSEQEIKAYEHSYDTYLKGIIQYNKTHLPVIPMPPLDIRKQYDQDDHIENEPKKTYDKMFSLYKECLSTTKTYASSTHQKPHIQEHFDNSEILQLGIAVNSSTSIGYEHDEAYNTTNMRLSLTSANNDILGSVENNYCIKAMLLDAMKSYEKLDKAVIQEDLQTNKNSTLTKMDAKRYPNELKSLNQEYARREYGRRNATLEAAGPAVIIRILDNIWPKAIQCIKNRDDLNPKEKSRLMSKAARSLVIIKEEDYDSVSRAAGIRVESICDNTWLGKKKLASFDAESIKGQFLKFKSDYTVNKSQAKIEEDIKPNKGPGPTPN